MEKIVRSDAAARRYFHTQSTAAGMLAQLSFQVMSIALSSQGVWAPVKKLWRLQANTLTPVTLELGGKDCMIVIVDANIEVAASAAVSGGLYNTGQTCCSVEINYC